MKILIACEESQEVCKAFRELGHEAYSCDILPCSGGYPEWHLQVDVFELLTGLQKHPSYHIHNTSLFPLKRWEWDLIVSFPPCTDLTVSGARWFSDKRADGSQERSIRFFFELWKLSNCTENPIGIMNGGKYIKKWFPELYNEMKDYGFPFKPDQIIQPWQFGHGETKATCLWLRGLPELSPTRIVDGREQRIWKLPPTPDRSKLRSKTFPGIAKEMAEQWGKINQVVPTTTKVKTMEKVKLTPEQKKISAKMRGLKMRVFNNCKPEEGKPGINAMKHQLEFLEAHPNTILPVPELSHRQTVECFKQGINKYLGVDTHND